MRFVSRYFIGLIFALAIALPTQNASAKTLSAAIPAGKKSVIYRYGVYDRNRCARASKPKVFRKTASHGTITVADSSFKMDKGPCKGLVLKGVVIYYQPEKGFNGSDRVSLGFSFPAGQDAAFNKTGGVTINLTVK